MSIFSDKYKSAQDDLKISADFKDRTEQLMKSIRDGEEPVDYRLNEKRNRRIIFMKSVSAVAAAAACIGAIVVFENQSETSIVSRDSVNEAIDSPVEEVSVSEYSETAVETVVEESAFTEEQSTSFAASVYNADEITVNEEVYELPQHDITTAPETRAIVSQTSSVVSDKESLVIPDADNADTVPDMFIAALPVDGRVSQTNPVTEALAVPSIDSPVMGSEKVRNENVSVEEEGNIVVASSSYIPLMTPDNAVNDFKTELKEAVITPNVDITDSYGDVTSYHSKLKINVDGSLVNNSALNDLISVIGIMIERYPDYTAYNGEMTIDLPEYVIDFIDNSGSNMKVYIGNGKMYINRYCSDAVEAYCFKLNEQDFTEMEMYICNCFGQFK